jgi:AraC-like DNA-binding protein
MGPEAMKNYTAANHYLTVILRQAAANSVDTEQLLRNAGIAPEILCQPHARVAVDKLAKLIQEAWQAMLDEHLGLTSHPSKIGTLYLMGKLAIHEPNLEQALKIGIRFYSLVEDDYHLSLTHEGDEATLNFSSEHPELDPHHFLPELVMVVWHRFASWLVGKNIALSRSTFAYPRPAHVDEYKFLFPCAHQFNQPVNSLTFHSKYLKRPILQREESLKDYFRRAPVDIFLKPENDDSYNTRIRLLIETTAGEGFPDFEEVASRLNMTSQTLRRKLKKEGSSYQAIKDLIRRDIAIYLLTQLELPIGDIAYRVGFTEPGAFIRAFKSWTGVTPGDYRRAE